MFTYVLLFIIGVAIACHIALSRDKDKITKIRKRFEKNKVKYRDGDNT